MIKIVINRDLYLIQQEQQQILTITHWNMKMKKERKKMFDYFVVIKIDRLIEI